MVLAVRVTITAPQLEDTVPISTGELIGLTGRSGAWVDRAGFQPEALPQPAPAHPMPPPPFGPVLTTVQLIAAVLAVLLPITDIIFRNAVPTVACGLVGPTGHGPAWTGEQRIGNRDAW